MKVKELISVYTYRQTANFVITMENNGIDEVTIFKWDANENRHPDDGSYGNVLYYMPDDIANAVVNYFTYIPKEMVIDNKIINTGTAETIYITIPTYGNLYRYAEDDNYPFI